MFGGERRPIKEQETCFRVYELERSEAMDELKVIASRYVAKANGIYPENKYQIFYGLLEITHCEHLRKDDHVYHVPLMSNQAGDIVAIWPDGRIYEARKELEESSGKIESISMLSEPDMKGHVYELWDGVTRTDCALRHENRFNLEDHCILTSPVGSLTIEEVDLDLPTQLRKFGPFMERLERYIQNLEALLEETRGRQAK